MVRAGAAESEEGRAGGCRGAPLEGARAVLSDVQDADFSADLLEQRFREAADATGMKAGDFFSPLRVAVTGRTVSPPLFASLELLGRDRSLARVDLALAKLAPVTAA